MIEYCVLRGISLFIKLRIDIPSEGKAIVQLINVKLSSLSKCEGWRGCIQFTNWYMTALKFSLSLSLSVCIYIYTEKSFLFCIRKLHWSYAITFDTVAESVWEDIVPALNLQIP